MIAAPATALSDIERDFAYCTGRLSAQMEHQWLFPEQNADQTAMQRDAMAELLFAIVPPEERRTALSLRISAKMAHANLLTQASFGATEHIRQHAEEQAQHKVTTCVSMLLG